MDSRQKKLLWAALGGTALLAGIYVRRLTSMTMRVKPREAISNGEKALASGRNILAVTAHPDDLEIFMGGTLKLLSERGCRVTVIDVTNDFPDLRLDHEETQLRAVLGKHVKEIKPDYIYAFDYIFPLRAIIHPDHLTVGRVLADVVDEQLGGKPQMYYYATRSPDALVDIAETLGDKITALRCHKSQLLFDDRIYNHLTTWLARYTAYGTGLQYAECFRVKTYHY